MEMPEHHDLEKFIHARLQKLPEREAPEDLLANVMARVRARESRPWWKQPFTSWPRGVQSMLFLLLGSVFSVVAYLAAKPAQAVSVDALAQHASSISWVPQLVLSWFDSAFITIAGLQWPWLAGIAAALAAMYLACVAAGLALFRITAARES